MYVFGTQHIHQMHLYFYYTVATIAKRRTIQQCVTQISHAVDEVDDDNTLDRVLSLLQQASASIIAASTDNPVDVAYYFEKKEFFSSTQKNETQLHFRQTTAKPGKRK